MARDRPEDDDAPQQRPQKRRKHSPPDNHSGNQASSSQTTPFTHAQYKFALSTTRTLKKNKHAGPFLIPVDYVAYNIPHYPTIVKQPMDLGTIDRKLLATQIDKTETMDGATAGYRTVDEWITDVRLIFQNTYTFNGLEHDVSKFAKKVEELFEKQIKKLPSATDEPASSMSPPAGSSTNPLKLVISRRGSTQSTNGQPGTTAALDGDVSATSLIQSPISKGASIPHAQKGPVRRKDETTGDLVTSQLRYCGKVLDELFKPIHQEFAWWFYDPVDPVQLPGYHDIIKKPMDLKTMRTKLEGDQYADASAFLTDFKQIITNCNTFNPPGSVAQEAARRLKELFDRKWKSMPKSKPGGTALRRSTGDSDFMERNGRASLEAASPSVAPSPAPSNVELPAGIRTPSLPAKPLPAVTRPQVLPRSQASKEPLKVGPPQASKTNVPSSQPAETTQAKPTPIKKLKETIIPDIPEAKTKLDKREQRKLANALGALTGADLENAVQWIIEGTAGTPRVESQSGDDVFALDNLPPSLVDKLYSAFVSVRPKRGLPFISKSQGTSSRPQRSQATDTGTDDIEMGW